MCFSLIIEKGELYKSFPSTFFTDKCHHIRICVYDVANCKLSWWNYVAFPPHTVLGQVGCSTQSPFLPYIIKTETEAQAEAMTDMCPGGREEP